jgi:hypothetical protein
VETVQLVWPRSTLQQQWQNSEAVRTPHLSLFQAHVWPCNTLQKQKEQKQAEHTQ